MALRIAVIVFLSFWSYWVQPAEGSQYLLRQRMFSSLDEIRGNGSLLLNVSPDPGISGQFVLFPNMKFNCSGYVKKVKFLSLPSHDTDNPMFGIGESIDREHYKVKYLPVINVSESGTRVEHSYPLGQMRYEAGDVFAVQQSHSKLLLYIQHGQKDRALQMFHYKWATNVHLQYWSRISTTGDY